MKIYADWIYDYIMSHNGFLTLISLGPHVLFILPYLLNLWESLLFIASKFYYFFKYRTPGVIQYVTFFTK